MERKQVMYLVRSHASGRDNSYSVVVYDYQNYLKLNHLLYLLNIWKLFQREKYLI